MPNVSPVPATPTNTASTDQPCSPTTADSEATVPTTPSPRAMIVNRPYLSTMWCACHGVPPSLVSAMNGPSASTTINISTITRVTGTEVCTNIVTNQPIWATVTHSA